MNKIHKLFETPTFLEASLEELRVLIVLSECPELSADEISEICKISRARASAAISLWRESGAIPSEKAVPTITEEFESKIERGEIEEESSKKVAKDIRDKGLADMISECARLMNKAALSSTEIKKLAALSTQYALTDEYILTLAAYMADKNKLTIPRLVDKALNLVGKNIDTLEALEAYIKITESENGIIRELKNIFGFNRPLSAKEKEYFIKWSSTYGYFTEIVGLAYDICVDNTSTIKISYIDKVLTAWYEAGCRTRSECLQKSEEVRLELAKKRKEKAAKKKEAEKERYGSFDAKDAFKRALERSYGSDEKK